MKAEEINVLDILYHVDDMEIAPCLIINKFVGVEEVEFKAHTTNGDCMVIEENLYKTYEEACKALYEEFIYDIISKLEKDKEYLLKKI